MIQFLRVIEKYKDMSGRWQVRCLYRDTDTGEEFGGFFAFEKNPADAQTNAKAAKRVQKIQTVRQEIIDEKAELAKIPERVPKPVVLIPEGER